MHSVKIRDEEDSNHSPSVMENTQYDSKLLDIKDAIQNEPRVVWLEENQVRPGETLSR